MFVRFVKKILEYISQFIKPINILILIIGSTILMFLLFHSILHFKSDYGAEVNLPLIDDTNQSLCYVNFVWNEDNKHLKFKNIFDDDELVKSDGKNIFFHVTNCIHNGLPVINPR